MRDFSARSVRLWRLPSGARFVYTMFLLLLSAALVVTVLLYVDTAGPGIDSAAQYYGGAPSQPATRAAPPEGGGPKLDLPPPGAGTGDGAVALQIHAPKPYRFLLERTHQHLFMMPLLWLVLSHLFLMAGFGRGLTGALVLGGGLAVPVHVAVPWLIRYGGPAYAWAMPVSGLALGLAFGGMIALSLWRLWRPPADERLEHPAE